MKPRGSRRLFLLLPRLWLVLWLSAAAILQLGTLYPTQHHLERSLQRASSSARWVCTLGCDTFGRDLLFLTLQSSLLSAALALTISLSAIFIGIIVGSATMLLPRNWAFFLARTNDFFLAFPSLLLALSWAAVRGPGWDTLLVALALGTLPTFIRLMQARALELSHEEYVTAARALGATRSAIIRRHTFPPLFQLGLIKLPALFAQALLAEASLSFLGLGAPLGRDTWGSLLAQARDYLIEAPQIAWVTGLPLALTILSLQLISDQYSEKHLRATRGLS